MKSKKQPAAELPSAKDDIIEDLIDLNPPEPSSADLIDLYSNESESRASVVAPWLIYYRNIGFKSHNPDPMLRRSVLIQGIAVGTGVVDLLDQLDCSTIISIKYLKSAGMRTKPRITTDTAIADFVDARHAEEFVQRSPASVILSLPSRPLDLTLVEKIRAGKVSRRLLLSLRPESDLEADSIRSIAVDGGWMLEFASILAASQAHTRLFFEHGIRAEYV